MACISSRIFNPDRYLYYVDTIILLLLLPIISHEHQPVAHKEKKLYLVFSLASLIGTIPLVVHPHIANHTTPLHSHQHLCLLHTPLTTAPIVLRSNCWSNPVMQQLRQDMTSGTGKYRIIGGIDTCVN